MKNNQLRAMAGVLRLFCLLPFATGLGDLAKGAQLLREAGANLSPEAVGDPILNSQIAFWGAMWFGYGILLWWATFDLLGRRVIVRILMATLFLSGLGRAFAALRFGSGPSVLVAAMMLELLGSAAFLLWFEAVTRTAPTAAFKADARSA